MAYSLSKPIVIVPYDPQWSILYAQEAARILAVTGGIVLAIEHIGSTAVPGLAAKPIIDMLAAVPELTAVDGCMESLQQLGYVDERIQVSDRRLFCKGPYNEGTHHLHFVRSGSAAWQLPIHFRDFLRSHPQAIEQYAALKQELAAMHGADLDGYTDGKGRFIAAALHQAADRSH